MLVKIDKKEIDYTQIVKVCCDEMTGALKENYVVESLGRIGINVWINFKRPTLKTIQYCPFCGEKITEQEQEE